MREATQYMPPSPATWQSSYLFARWHLFRHVGYLRHQQQVDLWPFNLESGVRVTCDVGYLCTNFSLPRPLCSWVRPDVRDRQTDRRQIKASLNASALWGGGILKYNFVFNTRLSVNKARLKPLRIPCTSICMISSVWPTVLEPRQA